MDYIAMVEKARAELLQEVNQRCDDLIRRYQEEQGISPKKDAVTSSWCLCCSD